MLYSQHFTFVLKCLGFFLTLNKIIQIYEYQDILLLLLILPTY